MTSKRELYAFGEPLGECVTRKEAGRLICGGGGGGSSTTTTNQVNDSYSELSDRHRESAMNLANQSFSPYRGRRVPRLNEYQTQGMEMIRDRATNGSETMRNAEAMLNNFINERQENPYLDSLVSRAQGSVVDQWNNATKPQIESSMVNSGSFGNSGLTQYMQNAQSNTQRALGDVASQMYGSAYETDQARRMAAIGLAPTFGNQAYTDANQLLGAGQVQYDNQQARMDAAYQQYLAQQAYPFHQLNAMNQALSAPGASSTTTSQTSGGK
jgi:hypothetical protein